MYGYKYGVWVQIQVLGTGRGTGTCTDVTMGTGRGMGTGTGRVLGTGIGTGTCTGVSMAREGVWVQGHVYGQGAPPHPPSPRAPRSASRGQPLAYTGLGELWGLPPALQRLLAAPRQLRWLDLPVNRLTAQPAPGQGGTSGASRPPGATRRDVPPPSIPHL